MFKKTSKIKQAKWLKTVRVTAKMGTSEKEENYITERKFQ